MVMTPSQATTAPGSVPENAQMRAGAAGLLRYHSAPSSVLSSFISDDEAFFCDCLLHVENSELAQLLSPLDDACASTVSHQNLMPVECLRAKEEMGSLNPMSPIHAHPARCHDSSTSTGHLSSICEHLWGAQSTDFHSSMPAVIMQVDMEMDRAPDFSLPNVAVPISASRLCQSRLATTKSKLVRHSSFPANFSPGHGTLEGCREGLTSDFSGLCAQTMIESRPIDNMQGTRIQTAANSKPEINIRVRQGDVGGMHFSHNKGKIGDTWCLESPLNINSSSLFRQSSSPSSFFSQSSFDGTMSGCERGLLSPSSASSSEDDRRGKEAQCLSRLSGFWDEVGLGGTMAFGQRKRERETEDKLAVVSRVLGSVRKCAAEEEPLQWSFDGQMDTSSGSLLRMDDSVLCRARAKRGCATHPRSIAERVRRTKISEGMRRLQELVPNMEKQTNTVTMLDEAVEYVKFLQQQVQKLSEIQAKCNGMCQSKGNT